MVRTEDMTIYAEAGGVETWVLRPDQWTDFNAALKPVWFELPAPLEVTCIQAGARYDRPYPPGHYVLRFAPRMVAKLREVFDPEGGYRGAAFDESDWIAHVDRLRSDGQLTVGDWHGYVVSPGDSFGPHVGPLYVLVTWRRDTSLVAVADKDPASVVRLASRLEVEL